MYIYDKQFTGPQDRREEQPLILRPSDRYHHPHPAPGVNGVDGEGVGQPNLLSLYMTPCIQDDPSKFIDFALMNSTIHKVLNEFDFRKSNLRTWHKTWIKLQFAPAIKASWRTSKPIRTIILIGHTDEVGEQSANYQLGKDRANAVAEEIKKGIGPDLSSKIKIETFSSGECWPTLPAFKEEAGGQLKRVRPEREKRNRRVDVYAANQTR
jgi:outer membrane protein OmpA-like peptidoglycan-associated protein